MTSNGVKIFITGVSSGIGKALAKELIKAGTNEVWGVARRGSALTELAAELGSDNFRHSVCDITSESQVNGVLAEMREHGFVPDVVVLNAGIYEPDLEQGYDHAKAVKVFDVNVYGALIWIERLLPVMRGKNKQFIAISSLARFRPDIHSVAYPAGKAALSMAMRSLELKHQESGPMFKSIHFGPVDTLVIPRYRQAKKSFFVISARQAADCVIRALGRDKANFYHPFLFSLFIRLTLWIPDRLFHQLTAKLRR